MAEPLHIITQTESWQQQVSDDVIKTLNGLLERAQTGELQGIAYSAVTIEGNVATGYSMHTQTSAIIGGLERVKHRMLASEQ